MPTDTETLARLNRMLKQSHPSEWTREVFPGDVDAIRWAVERIGELKGALRPARVSLAEHRCGTGSCHCCPAIAGIDAAIDSAPAKEGEKP